jgi:hypothetical protein
VPGFRRFATPTLNSDGFGRLCGFAISESGDAGFAILMLAGYRFLYAEALSWVLANWGRRRPCPSTEVTERQTSEREDLKRAGFRLKSEFSRRCFDLTCQLPERPKLDDGFTTLTWPLAPAIAPSVSCAQTLSQARH